MIWEINYTDEFGTWWDDLTEDQQEAHAARVLLLAQAGPALPRPIVDTISASQFPNMKELRTSKDGSLRVLFAFDPNREAILLLGGDKTGQWSEWYATAIPAADELYRAHLATLDD